MHAQCPQSVADIADCHSARDENGAWLLAAIPKKWNHRLIVHAHGGTVSVVSTAEAGTTFTVRLPKEPAAKRSS